MSRCPLRIFLCSLLGPASLSIGASGALTPATGSPLVLNPGPSAWESALQG